MPFSNSSSLFTISPKYLRFYGIQGGPAPISRLVGILAYKGMILGTNIWIVSNYTLQKSINLPLMPPCGFGTHARIIVRMLAHCSSSSKWVPCGNILGKLMWSGKELVTLLRYVDGSGQVSSSRYSYNVGNHIWD